MLIGLEDEPRLVVVLEANWSWLQSVPASAGEASREIETPIVDGGAGHVDGAGEEEVFDAGEWGCGEWGGG